MTTFTHTAQNNAVKASTYLNEIDEIYEARQSYEQNELARSNKRLYEILADVLRTYQKATANKHVMKETVFVLTQRLEAKGARIQGNTKALALFVRYIFDSERQATHIYVRALQAAISAGVDADGLVEFIQKAGGVDGCKKQAKPSAMVEQKKEKIANAMHLVDELLTGQVKPALGVLKVEQSLVQNTFEDGITFLIGKADTFGNVKVLSVVPAQSKPVLNWAKEQLALHLSAEQQSDAKKVKVNRAVDAMSAAISVAAEMASKLDAGEATVADVLEA